MSADPAYGSLCETSLAVLSACCRVGQARLVTAELGFEHVVLLAVIRDDLLMVAIAPAGQHHRE